MKRSTFLLFVFLLLARPTLADELNAYPATTTAAPGAIVEIQLDAKFNSQVIGGEFLIDYDEAVVELVGVAWNTGYGDDPLLRCPPVIGTSGSRGCPGDRRGLAFGQLAGLPSNALAILQFRTVANGTTEVALLPASPFSSPTGSPVPMTYDTVDIMVVPEPATALGLAAGVLALGCAGRRKGRKRAWRRA